MIIQCILAKTETVRNPAASDISSTFAERFLPSV